VAEGEVIRDLLVALGAKVDPKTKKDLDDFDDRLVTLKARMVEVASYVPQFAASLASIFKPEMIADAKEMNKLLAAQPAAIAKVTKAATEASKARAEARDAKVATREAERAAKAETAAAKMRAKVLAESVAKVKEQTKELAEWALFGAKAIAGMFLAGISAATAAAVSTGQWAEQVERQAAALNLTREEYQELAHVFGTFGADSGDIADGLSQINEKAQDAIAGEKGVIAEFTSLGITVAQLKGKRPHELLELIAEASSTATDRGKALAGTSKILGEDLAKKLGPALVGGAKGIQKLRLEAHELGVVMDEGALAKSAELAKQWRTLKTSATGLKNEIGVALAPMVDRLVRSVTDWVKANRAVISGKVEVWARNLDRLLVQVDKTVRRFGGWDVVFLNVATGVGMLTVIANLGKIETALGAVKMALMAVRAVGASMFASVGLAGAPVLLILGALVVSVGMLYLAFEDLYTYFTGGTSIFGTMLDQLAVIVPAFGNWRTFVGSLLTLFKALWGVIKAVATGATDGLTPALKAISDALNPVRRVVNAVVGALRRLSAAMADVTSFGFLADWAKSINTAAYNLGGQAPGIQAQVQGAVAVKAQGAVDRVSGASSTDNSSRSVNSTVNIHGGSPHAWAREAASQRRLAGFAVKGTEQ